VIEAAVEARRELPALTLTIVGDGPDREALHALVADHQAQAWIEFAGRVEQDDLVDIYRRSWIVASGSLAEGWGLSLTEAAGCGTPAVATDIRGHRSSVVADVTGLLVEPAELATAFVKVLRDGQLRQGLADAALARVRTLTWDSSALGIIRVLAQAADERS